MIRVKNALGAVALSVLAVTIGCGEGGSSSSGGAAPTSGQVAQAQKADAGGQAVELTEGIATDALVESGAPGATSSKAAAAGQPVSMAPSASFNFQGTVNVTVDLDVQNSAGQDAFPHASGIFAVAATGTVTGTDQAGEATYAVTVTWNTDGTFVDPVCNASATIASGSSWNYSLKVQWSRTDDLNWSVAATSDVDAQASGTVTHGGTTWTVSGTVQRHATASFSRVAGAYQFAWGVNGEKTVVVSSGAESHTVVVEMKALDHILITVDGATFGPYTVAQVRAIFHFDCRG